MLKKLALLLLGIALALVILELGLRGAAWYVQRQTRGELPVAWVTGNLRILCLGDSVTYGILVPREQSYPAQLEALWNERVASPKVEVLNLGLPGTNSSRLVRELPRLLDTFSPDITILLVGVNDFWTIPSPLDEASADRPQRGWLERNSRIYKLYYLLRRGLVGRDLEIEIDPEGNLERSDHKARFGDRVFALGFAKGEPGLVGDLDSLRANLRTLVAQAKAAGTQLYLMSYPARQRWYAMASPALRQAAEETGTPFVDLAAVFEPLCPEPECPRLFLYDQQHPNAAGNALIAEAIVKRLSPPARP
jgi:lysophospholipase L1-like esterase